ncbi:MAG: VanZ family protein [Gemmatimonadaceae bacterium]|nr:VanZ family protein [Gemmatimonadaceae bacterium]
MAILAYLTGVTLIITLLPFQFAWPREWRVMLTGNAVDIVANVLMFVPLGFLYRLGTTHHRRHSALRVLWMGALVSSAIESAQLFELERYTSPLDVATNAAGAWLGALASDRVASRLRAGGAMVARFSLELPLMGLVYLLIPLLWLNALASGGEAEHAGLSVLLAVFGASVLGGLQKHHFGPDRHVSPAATACVTMTWYAAGSFPLLPTHPIAVGAGAIVAGLLAWRRGTVGHRGHALERRYEVRVLLSAVPAYATYLALLGAGPLLGGVGPWSVGLGFPGVATEWTKLEILRLLELVAAFTLLGYIQCETRGRSVDRYVGALPRLVAWTLVAVAAIEALRGLDHAHGASVARAVLLFASSLYGGGLYYLQRAHILHLLGDATRAEPVVSERGSPGAR